MITGFLNIGDKLDWNFDMTGRNHDCIEFADGDPESGIFVFGSVEKITYSELDTHVRNGALKIFRDNIQLFPLTMKGFCCMMDDPDDYGHSLLTLEMAQQCLSNQYLWEFDRILFKNFLDAVWRAASHEGASNGYC